jgi:phospholipid/cholesterol/gamma-HCH transport system substrate-binding protein
LDQAILRGARAAAVNGPVRSNAIEPQARYSVVGISVVLLMAMLLFAGGWLLRSGNGKEVRPYTLYFARQSLEGLDTHSEVRMKGIRIGSVASFSFSTRRPGNVEVSIDVDAQAPIRQSTRAVVDRNLITGLAGIRLVTLDEASPLLRNRPTGEAHAVIAEGESQLQQVSETMNQLAQRADETLQRISSTLSVTNQQAVRETLENLRLASRNANAMTRRLDATLVSVGDASKTLSALTLGAGADLHRLADRYDALGAETAVTVHEAGETVHQWRTDGSRLVSRTDGLLGDADIQMRLTGQRLRSAADAIGSTSYRLDDPRAALFGPGRASLGPGEATR